MPIRLILTEVIQKNIISLIIVFFPKLIAGPIVHHKEMTEQFSSTKNKSINYDNITAGLFLFSTGLFKKSLLADTFSIWADSGFDKSAILTFPEAWATSLSYLFQLYFDFSGYVDMASGAALLFNIHLPFNFNSPYKATEIQDFWRRWHITLSRLLKDYIYMPLGGNRSGNILTYRNLLLTFIAGGIWHGAGLNFIFWGFLHGCAIVIHKIWEKSGFKLNNFWGWFIILIFFNFSLIFFRTETAESALKVLKGMSGFSLQN